MRNRYGRSFPIWALIAINIFVFIITTIRPDIGNYLALSIPISGFSYWTIATAMFVHANFLHILFNMMTLYFLGTFCLELIDTKWFFVVYFIGGLFGNILYLLMGPANSAVVGASGAIFAISGVLVMMRPNQRVYLYFLIPMPLWVGIVGSLVVLSFMPNVAWQGHLGGFIVGLIAGFFFRQKERQQSRLTSTVSDLRRLEG